MGVTKIAWVGSTPHGVKIHVPVKLGSHLSDLSFCGLHLDEIWAFWSLTMSEVCGNCKREVERKGWVFV
jgi:hypothetical protein